MSLALALLTSLAAGASTQAPITHAAFISVNVQFTNKSDRTLTKISENLDHGCWGTHPPDTIASGAFVTWESESCGVLTGTEGEVDYQIGGEPAGTTAHFHWDDPTIGSNSFDGSTAKGYATTANGPDHGDNITATFTFGCSSTTCDGIADDWKLNGVWIDNTNNQVCGPAPRPASCQFINLPAMGANVNKPDIFLQIDWMADANHSLQLSQAAIQQVVTAFANSPYVAVNGAVGINLHVDHGANSVNLPAGLRLARQLAHQTNLGSGTVTTYNWTTACTGTTCFDTIKNAPGGFTSTGRGPIFHYVISAHDIAGLGNSGISRGIPGSDLIISLGAFCNLAGGGCAKPLPAAQEGGTQQNQAGTLMHELGHNLSLGHGGGDGVNNKPNYFSVMNYDWQLNGLIVNGAQGAIDYSRSTQPNLGETALNESAGLGGTAATFGTQHWCPAAPGVTAGFVTVNTANGPIDWNCDGNIKTGTVAFDTNNDGAQTSLAGYNDWQNLKLRVGAIGIAGAVSLPTETEMDPLTPEVAQLILPLDTAPPVTTATASPPANANGWNKTDVTVTLSASDDISGVAKTEWNLNGAGWVTYSGPVVISQEGPDTLQYRSVDRSQNLEPARSLTVMIDKTLPTVTYTGNAGTYTIDQDITIVCTAADPQNANGTPGSGLASTTCQNVTGPAYTFILGSNTVTATATDRADNIGSGSTTFTVKVTYASLCNVSRRLVTNTVMSTGMCRDLQAAELNDRQGVPQGKLGELHGYKQMVAAALQSHFLTAAQAAILTQAADLL